MERFAFRARSLSRSGLQLIDFIAFYLRLRMACGLQVQHRAISYHEVNRCRTPRRRPRPPHHQCVRINSIRNRRIWSETKRRTVRLANSSTRRHPRNHRLPLRTARPRSARQTVMMIRALIVTRRQLPLRQILPDRPTTLQPRRKARNNQWPAPQPNSICSRTHRHKARHNLWPAL